MMGYYDLVLGLIPAAILGVTGLLHGVGYDLTVALLIAGLIAAGLVGHALFVRAPVDSRERVSVDSSDRTRVPSAD